MLAERPDTQDLQVEGFGKKQIVTELDMETWKVRRWATLQSPGLIRLQSQAAIDVFDIRDSFFPTRKPAMQRIGNKWYA